MLISEKITMFIAAWMVFILIITIDVKFEIFFILIFIGFLTVKVFADRFILTRLKDDEKMQMVYGNHNGNIIIRLI